MNQTLYKTMKTALLISVVTLSIMFGGCDKLIYDDMSDCPIGVYLSFYTANANSDTLTVFPSKESQQNITVLVFNKENLLVSTKNETLPIKDSFTNRAKMFITMPQPGEYSFVAWSGTVGGYNLNTLTIGTTRKEDILAELNQSETHIDATQRVELYHGIFRTHAPATGNLYTESEHFGSNTVIFNDPAIYGSQFYELLVPMNELTRRVYIKAKNLIPSLNSLQNLSIVIKDKNGKFIADGSISETSQNLVFTPTISDDNHVNGLIDFLTLGTIYENSSALLEVSFTDPSGGSHSYSYKLIDLIKADPQYTHILYEFTYDYYLEIEFIFHISAAGQVMNWTLVTRDIELTPLGY